MAVLFVSDIHLSAARPAVARLFCNFLCGPARQADALYILGDLFDSWAGDDDLHDEFNLDISASLRALTETGVPVYFMAGNRDFLLGEGFARASGLRLLAEPAQIEAGGMPTLLMHGDTLCTGDHAYQAFRREVRSAEWQRAFLSLPLDERKARIRILRRDSEAEKRAKPMEIMDVNRNAVLQALTLHRCRRLIHGHTHRPALHRFEIGQQACERWVLPDWSDKGGYLLGDADGCRLLAWPG